MSIERNLSQSPSSQPDGGAAQALTTGSPTSRRHPSRKRWWLRAARVISITSGLMLSTRLGRGEAMERNRAR